MKYKFKIMVVKDRWSLFGDGRWLRFGCNVLNPNINYNCKRSDLDVLYKKSIFFGKTDFYGAIQIIRDTLGGGGSPKCHLNIFAF